MRTCRLELISVLHDTVNEEGAVDARRVVHAFAAAAVPLLFVVVALAEGVLVEVAECADLIGHFQVLHVVNFASGEHVGALDGTLADLLVDDGLVHFFFDGVGEG